MRDSGNSYGWVSIVLHWLTAAWVLCLWFLGNSSQSFVSDNSVSWAQLHVSIGTAGIVLVLLRIWWRWHSGHPRIEGQSDLMHQIAKLAHYIMLAAIAVLLITGPLIPWSVGAPLVVFEKFVLHSPFAAGLSVAAEIRTLHFWASTTVIVLSMLHIAGAFKHMMFNHDETFIRMLIPKKP